MRRLAFLITAALALLPAAIADARVKPRIVGGTQTAPGHYPWQVALISDDGYQYCGGTLVARQWVLTADHCEVDTDDWVRVQSNDLMTGPWRDVAEVIRHPQADAQGDDATLRYDVALLRLSAPVDDARPLVVADTSESSLWAAGKLLTITGWGETEDDSTPPNLLREARVPRVADATCSSLYGSYFHQASMFCAGYQQGGTDTCQGDSGGPIIAPTRDAADRRNPAHWRLVGVTSWGVGCADPDAPGVYARITEPSIRTWITATIPAEDPVDTTLVDGPDDGAAAPPGGGATDRWDVPATGPADPPLPEPAYAVQPEYEDDVPYEDAEEPEDEEEDEEWDEEEDEPAPAARGTIKRADRRCTRRRSCTFTVAASSGTRSVRAQLTSTVRRPCTRKGRRTTCTKRTTTKLKARRTGSGRFRVATSRLRPGSYTLTLTPAGGKPFRVRFTIR